MIRGFVAVLALVGALEATLRAQPVVPGFDRFHRRFLGTPFETGSGDLVLIEGLGCANCHGELPSVVRGRPAPTLVLAAEWSPGELASWIDDPAAMKPGTTMPRVPRSSDPAVAARELEVLVAYVRSLAEEATTSTTTGDSRAGDELFGRIGCAACHGAPPGDGEPRSGFFGWVERSWRGRRSSLVRFLLDPLRYRPSARMPRVPMSEEEAAHIAAFLAPEGEPATGVGAPPDPALVREGRDVFRRVGCAACHVPPGEERLVGFGPRWDRYRNGGCIATRRPVGSPDYGLDDFQRLVLMRARPNVAAVTASTVQPLATDLAAYRAFADLEAYGCLECHERGGHGGPRPEVAALFTSSGDDLGDEGRFPPSLTGVGGKLRGEAVERVLRGDGAVRPYLDARMPDFGPEVAREISFWLGLADPAFEPRERSPNERGRGIWGRELVGAAGLRCITCHDVRGVRSLGVRAIDLRTVRGRLRRGWFERYLVDPQSLRPGTRMPSFWPDGQRTVTIGGDTWRQLDSIWAYLQEIEESRLPDGLEPEGSFELVPQDAPIVFRTFVEGAGMRAVAVGYPEGRHAVFDAGACVWRRVWAGRFLDAEGTWHDRFAPLAKPLGEELEPFPREPAVEIAEGEGKVRYLGHRLESGVPVFEYRVSGDTTTIDVADRLTPIEGGLRRELAVTGAAGARIVLRLVAADRIEDLGEGRWRADDRFDVRASLRGVAVEATVREREKGAELAFELSPGDAEFSVAWEILWR